MHSIANFAKMRMFFILGLLAKMNIKIVLVGTTHPGNIGSSARAMKTMGLKQLCLVTPKSFPHPKANELASGADDILEGAKVYSSLAEAVADCQWIIGTSARSRDLPLVELDPKQAAIKAITLSQSAPIAIVFGREKCGLTNEELSHCHNHLSIPSHPDYMSLNLAAAVQVVCYECRMAHLAVSPSAPKTIEHERYATAEEMEYFIEHLSDVLSETKFLFKETPKRLIPRLRRLVYRFHLENMELRIMRGILTSIQRKWKKL